MVFDEAWRLVRDNFYDRNLKGLDWDKIGDAHRREYLAANTDKERSQAINAMLRELQASHMLHATTAEPAYYQFVRHLLVGPQERPAALFSGWEDLVSGDRHLHA